MTLLLLLHQEQSCVCLSTVIRFTSKKLEPSNLTGQGGEARGRRKGSTRVHQTGQPRSLERKTQPLGPFLIFSLFLEQQMATKGRWGAEASFQEAPWRRAARTMGLWEGDQYRLWTVGRCGQQCPGQRRSPRRWRRCPWPQRMGALTLWETS